MLISSSCEAAHQELERGEVDHRDRGGDGGLEVLGETAVAAEPREGSFNGLITVQWSNHK
jgi:hypothetical protein